MQIKRVKNIIKYDIKCIKWNTVMDSNVFLG